MNESTNNPYKSTNDIIQDIIQTSNKLESDGAFIPVKELMQGYDLFNQKFGPDKLKELDGEELIESLFNTANRDSLVYWLEYKNDDEFKTNMETYGSIASGSAYKFDLFKRKKDENWIAGSPQKSKILTISEAIDFGTEIRDSLLYGADLIDDLSEDVDINEYIYLQEQLEETLTSNMANRMWVHKYYHMIYPSKIDNIHTSKLQRHALISCNIKPKKEDGLYVMSGQLMEIVKKTNINSAYAINSMIHLFGNTSSYYRIGTRSA